MRTINSRGSKAGRRGDAAGAARKVAKLRAAGSHAARAVGEPGSVDIYEAVTARIVAELEAGRAPWVQPWGAG